MRVDLRFRLGGANGELKAINRKFLVRRDVFGA